jgi:hypothetical protein
MSQEQIDYSAVLEDLKKRRDQLDAAIAVITQLQGSGAIAFDAVASSAAVQGPVDQPIETGTFFNLSTPDAIRKYLGMTKRPRKARDITKALQDGGIRTVSSNFYTVVLTTLKRGKDFMQLPSKEWGLAEWYPGRLPKPRAEPKGKNGPEDQTAESEA